MRYDAPEHLQTWKKLGRFPAIHDKMFNLVCSNVVGVRFLDLCCSTGLLGERISRKHPGTYVVGVDSDQRALELGTEAGITWPRLWLDINEASAPKLFDFIAEHRITVLLARRCMPELCGNNLDFARALAAGFRVAGITEVALQGRVYTPQSVHPMACLDIEIDSMSSGYRVVQRHGDLAYLRKKAG